MDTDRDNTPAYFARCLCGCKRVKMQALFNAADVAYSEMAFAVHDLAGRRLSEAQINYRSKRLAKAADELHAALKAIDGRRE